MNDSRTESRAPTKKQREALEIIRAGRVYWGERDNMLGIRYAGPGPHGRPVRGMRLDEFNRGVLRRLEKLGLITREDDALPSQHHARITDAGRVALGDWAAGEDR